MRLSLGTAALLMRPVIGSRGRGGVSGDSPSSLQVRCQNRVLEFRHVQRVSETAAPIGRSNKRHCAVTVCVDWGNAKAFGRSRSRKISAQIVNGRGRVESADRIAKAAAPGASSPIAASKRSARKTRVASSTRSMDESACPPSAAIARKAISHAPRRAAARRLAEDEVIRVSAGLVCDDLEFANERPLDKTRVNADAVGPRQHRRDFLAPSGLFHITRRRCDGSRERCATSGAASMSRALSASTFSGARPKISQPKCRMRPTPASTAPELHGAPTQNPRLPAPAPSTRP